MGEGIKIRLNKAGSILLTVLLMLSVLSSCSAASPSEEPERIHQGLCYNIDESIVDMENFMDMVKELSSQKYLGRRTGTEENMMAVRYIADKFEKLGLKKANGMQDYTQDYKLNYHVNNDAANVVGVIPGMGNGGGIIIIGAHLDHLGGFKDQYYPGALDNASGVAAITEIARVLIANDIAPKKTILFIAFNGEETGFTGSQYYVDNPLYPLERSILINMDQIGSKAVLPLYLISNDREGGKLKDDFYKLAAELNINREKVMYRNSDHRFFEEKGVDVVTLVHPFTRDDGYHTPNDTPNVVSSDRAREVINLVLYYLDKSAY